MGSLNPDLSSGETRSNFDFPDLRSHGLVTRRVSAACANAIAAFTDFWTLMSADGCSCSRSDLELARVRMQVGMRRLRSEACVTASDYKAKSLVYQRLLESYSEDDERVARFGRDLAREVSAMVACYDPSSADPARRVAFGQPSENATAAE